MLRIVYHGVIGKIYRDMIRQFLSSKMRILTSLLVGFIMLAYLSSFIKSYIRLRASDQRLYTAQDELKELEQQKKNLQRQLELVETDEYKEYQAREKLGLIKEGELVVILPSEDILRRLSPRKADSEQLTLPLPNWRKWIEILFNV